MEGSSLRDNYGFKYQDGQLDRDSPCSSVPQSPEERPQTVPDLDYIRKRRDHILESPVRQIQEVPVCRMTSPPKAVRNLRMLSGSPIAASEQFSTLQFQLRNYYPVIQHSRQLSALTGIAPLNSPAFETELWMTSDPATEKASKTKKKRRRYVAKSLPENLRTERRTIANARERARVQRMADAFDVLKGVLPKDLRKSKMKKIDILNAAIFHIDKLAMILSAGHEFQNNHNVKSRIANETTNQLLPFNSNCYS